MILIALYPYIKTKVKAFIQFMLRFCAGTCSAIIVGTAR